MRFVEMNVTELQDIEGGRTLPVLPPVAPPIGVELGIKLALFVAKLFAND